MKDFLEDSIGVVWLSRVYDIYPVAKFSVRSQVGGRRKTKSNSDGCIEIYPEIMRPADNAVKHLEFYLRHEVVNLEFLARLFKKMGPVLIQEWINTEPTGKYARRTAFLYEWLTGDTLSVPDRLGGNYVDAIDSHRLIAASPQFVEKVKRWRINNNLPGTPDFCPMLVLSESLIQAMNLNVPSLLNDFKDEFGSDQLRRSSVWLRLRESKASFEIEGEGANRMRTQRFDSVLEHRTGRGEIPLSDTALAQLQGEILGETTTITQFGLRQSPVFVGEALCSEEIVHYIAPPPDKIAKMLDGLQIFLERTQGQSSIMRAAVVSFGFVYIHPLADANGRVHRFLINDILRRDGVIPDGMILPVSAVIASNASERKNYNQVLDEIAEPLMHRIQEFVSIASKPTSYPDGVVSNIEFDGESEAEPAWRYPRLESHIIFLSKVLYQAITHDVLEQLCSLRKLNRTRQVLKEIVEMPDQQADLVLQSIEQNQGVLSNVLAKIPILAKPGIWEQIVEAVTLISQEEELISSYLIRRYRLKW